jgi:hypothetical protein
MAAFPNSSPGYTTGSFSRATADLCWVGASSAFETRLLTPVPIYPLEQLRQRFLYAVVDPHDIRQGARVVLQMAFEVDTASFLNKLIDVPPDVPRSKVCARRTYLAIDGDMRMQRYLIGPAIDALADIPNVPIAYIDLLRDYAMAPYARYRTCALAATVCLSARMLTV